MAIEKSLTQMPLGIEEEAEMMAGEPDLEIEVVDPEELKIEI